jgi:plastocyanin
MAIGVAALALLVVACGGGAPGWTYAPAPSVTPPPSVAPSEGGESAAPSDGGESAAPSDGGESAAPSDGGTGAAVQISAVNIAFDQSAVEAPADTPFQIEFANNDPGIPHNVEIKDAGGASVFLGEIFNGVETRTYDVPALAAGEYAFICTVHPNMTGTLTAG